MPFAPSAPSRLDLERGDPPHSVIKNEAHAARRARIQPSTGGTGGAGGVGGVGAGGGGAGAAGTDGGGAMTLDLVEGDERWRARVVVASPARAPLAPPARQGPLPFLHPASSITGPQWFAEASAESSVGLSATGGIVADPAHHHHPLATSPLASADTVSSLRAGIAQRASADAVLAARAAAVVSADARAKAARAVAAAAETQLESAAPLWGESAAPALCATAAPALCAGS